MRVAAIILLFFWSMPCKAQYEYLLHKPYAERYEQLDSIFFGYIEKKYDSVEYFRETDKLTRLAKKKGDKDLYLEAKLRRGIYYRDGVQANGNTLLPYFAILLKEAEQRKCRHVAIRCYLFMAAHYMDRENNPGAAVYHFLKCYHLMKIVPVSEFPNKKEPMVYTGVSLRKLHDIDNSQKILLEADVLPLKTAPGRRNQWVLPELKNTLGLYYLSINRDSALYYFKQGLEIAKQQNSHSWVSTISGNIARCYARYGDYKKALELTDKGMPPYIDSSDMHGLWAYLSHVAEYRIKLKDYIGAGPYVFLGRDIVMHTDDLYYCLFVQYRIMADYYAGIGRPDKAYLYSDSALVANDSLKNWQTVMNMARSRQKIENELYTSELSRVDAETKTKLLWRNVSIVVVLLVSIILILFINRQALKHKQKRRLAEADLKNAENQLNDFIRSIHEKNALIESITREIEKYQALPHSNELPGNNEVLWQLQQSVLLTEEQWVSFKSNFEKVHTGFFTRLNRKLPDLTPAETRFMALSKLRLSNKEMAAMLGISMQAVRNYKYRLFKKLNMPDDSAVEELLQFIG